MHNRTRSSNRTTNIGDIRTKIQSVLLGILACTSEENRTDNGVLVRIVKNTTAYLRGYINIFQDVLLGVVEQIS